MNLFQNPNQQKKYIAIFLTIFVTLVALATCAKSAELDLGGGSTYMRGKTPYIEATIIWPKQIHNIDLYAGAMLVGNYDYQGENNNQIVLRAGIRPRVGRFTASLGVASIQAPDALNSGSINFNLGLSLAITKDLTLHIGHISNAGTHRPNVGRDLVGFTWTFR